MHIVWRLKQTRDFPQFQSVPKVHVSKSWSPRVALFKEEIEKSGLTGSPSVIWDLPSNGISGPIHLLSPLPCYFFPSPITSSPPLLISFPPYSFFSSPPLLLSFSFPLSSLSLSSLPPSLTFFAFTFISPLTFKHRVLLCSPSTL